MLFYDGELDYLMIRLQERLHDLLIQYPGPRKQNTVKGIIGEKFVAYCIGHSLWRLGYCLDPSPHPRSYSLTRKFGCNATGHGGMDYLLNIVDGKGMNHRILIEVKNWKHYSYLPPTTFRKKILNRFRRVDANREYQWVLAMNTRNIPLIKARCTRNHIYILPIAHHITPEWMRNDNTVRDLFSSFLESFCTYITSTVPEDIYRYIIVENQGKDTTIGIIQDLFLGVPYDVIGMRYDVSIEYIMRLASDLRGKGVYLPDRREEEWVVQRVIQE